jgi:hypothetical protein
LGEGAATLQVECCGPEEQDKERQYCPQAKQFERQRRRDGVSALHSAVAVDIAIGVSVGAAVHAVCIAAMSEAEQRRC